MNQLRRCQDAVLGIVEKIMTEMIPNNRASRDYRVKFPDDVLQESLAGQLWFGAEVRSIICMFLLRFVNETAQVIFYVCLKF